MDKVNIQQLADELGLSIATVSRALRNSHQIRPETREKVWELANKLNYQPNPFAAGLRAQKSKNIAVIFPELANNFFSLAINGIEEIAREKDYQVLIYLTHESAESETRFVKSLASGRVDGALVSLSRETANYDHLTELNKKLPVILFDRVCNAASMLNVTTDDYESSYAGTKHLVEQGCRKIMYLLALKNIMAGGLRLQGYKDALADSGILLDEALIIDCEQDEKAVLLIIKEAITRHQPDALFSSIEKLGIVCYQVAKEMDLVIPGKIKLLSFSNLETAPLLHPSLTTITQPAFDIGKESARLLFELLEKKRTIPQSKTIASILVKRASTALASG